METIDISEIRKFTKLIAPEADFDKAYTFYYDETNNIRKFYIRRDYDFNAAFTENFVLGGLVHEGTAPDVQPLIDSLNLQDNIKEIKLKHLAKGGFLECLRSRKLNLFLKFIKGSSLDIHYSSLNILYWSIVDIVDSAIANSEVSQKLGIQFANKLKDDLYKLSRLEIKSVKSLFRRFEYPNIKRDSVLLFIEELSYLFEEYLDNMEYHFGLESLRQILKEAKRSGSLPFIMDEDDFILIKDFSQFYLRPVYLFKNSTHIFDDEDSIAKEFQRYKIVDGSSEINNYSFVDSKTNQLTQLSDIFVGLIGKLSVYINTSSREKICSDFRSLGVVQRENVDLLLGFEQFTLNFLDDEINNTTIDNEIIVKETENGGESTINAGGGNDKITFDVTDAISAVASGLITDVFDSNNNKGAKVESLGPVYDVTFTGFEGALVNLTNYDDELEIDTTVVDTVFEIQTNSGNDSVTIRPNNNNEIAEIVVLGEQEEDTVTVAISDVINPTNLLNNLTINSPNLIVDSSNYNSGINWKVADNILYVENEPILSLDGVEFVDIQSGTGTNNLTIEETNDQAIVTIDGDNVTLESGASILSSDLLASFTNYEDVISFDNLPDGRSTASYVEDGFEIYVGIGSTGALKSLYSSFIKDETFSPAVSVDLLDATSYYLIPEDPNVVFEIVSMDIANTTSSNRTITFEGAKPAEDNNTSYSNRVITSVTIENDGKFHTIGNEENPLFADFDNLIQLVWNGPVEDLIIDNIVVRKSFPELRESQQQPLPDEVTDISLIPSGSSYTGAVIINTDGNSPSIQLQLNNGNTANLLSLNNLVSSVVSGDIAQFRFDGNLIIPDGTFITATGSRGISFFANDVTIGTGVLFDVSGYTQSAFAGGGTGGDGGDNSDNDTKKPNTGTSGANGNGGGTDRDAATYQSGDTGSGGAGGNLNTGLGEGNSDADYNGLNGVTSTATGIGGGGGGGGGGAGDIYMIGEPNNATDGGGGGYGGTGADGRTGKKGGTGGAGINNNTNQPTGGAGGTGGKGGEGGAGGSGGKNGEEFVAVESGSNGSRGKGRHNDGSSIGASTYDGNDGSNGTGGTNNTTGLIISGGTGGSGGGEGGAGGQGGGGGAGGGGGGRYNIAADAKGGKGGGAGGKGGAGGDGGAGGAGGAGGGALEILAQGLITANYTEFLAKGGDGSRGNLGSRGGDGSNGTSANSDNVSGRADGGSGGKGGQGGWGGYGAPGAGGAGGTIKLYGSILDASLAAVDTSGGMGGFPINSSGTEAPGGGNGRLILGGNTVSSGNLGGTPNNRTNTRVETFDGVRDTNPFINGGNVSQTPLIAGLLGGAEVYGYLDTTADTVFSANNFSIPDDAVAAVYRLDLGPSGYSQNYYDVNSSVDFDMLLFINLSDNPLVDPLLGIDRNQSNSSFMTELLTGGFATDTRFGGSGTDTVIEWMPVGGVWGTLIPEDDSIFVNAMVDGPVDGISGINLQDGQYAFIREEAQSAIPSALTGIVDMVLSPDGNHIYGVSSEQDALVVVNADDLTQRQFFKDGFDGISGLGGANAVAINDDGTNVYVASADDQIISVFNRDTTTGNLSLVQEFALPSGQVESLDVLGNRLFVSGSETPSVRITGDGLLTSLYITDLYSTDDEITDFRDFGDLKAVTTTYTTSVEQVHTRSGFDAFTDLVSTVPMDDFAVTWEGQIEVANNGGNESVTFYLGGNENEVSRLFINGESIFEIFDNGELDNFPYEEKQAIIPLSSGTHDIRVEYLGHPDWERIDLEYQISGQSRQQLTTGPNDASTAGILAYDLNNNGQLLTSADGSIYAPESFTHNALSDVNLLADSDGNSNALYALSQEDSTFFRLNGGDRGDGISSLSEVWENIDLAAAGLSNPIAIAVSDDARKDIYIVGDGKLGQLNLQTQQFDYLLEDGFNGVQGLTDASAIAIGKSDVEEIEFVYVTSGTNSSIAIFQRDTNTGELTFQQIVSGLSGLYDASAIATDIGKVYVASSSGFGVADGGIASFDVAIADSGDFIPRQLDISFNNISELAINTGANNDTITQLNSSSANKLSIDGGSLVGDVIELENVSGEVSITTDAGNDSISVKGGSVTNLTINGNDGNNAIQITNLEVTNGATITTGEGEDVVNITDNGSNTIANLNLRTNAGEDTVEAFNLNLTGINSIDVGADADVVNLSDVEGLDTLNTDSGEDIVNLSGVNGEISATQVSTGDDADTVTINSGSSVNDLNINTSTGDDQINLQSAGADDQIIVAGGNNDDTFEVIGTAIDANATITLQGNAHDNGDTLNFNAGNQALNPAQPTTGSGTIQAGSNGVINYETIESIPGNFTSTVVDIVSVTDINEGEDLSVTVAATPATNTTIDTATLMISSNGRSEEIAVNSITTAGTNISITWDTLSSLGFADDGTYTITLEVTDSAGTTVTTNSNFTITNVNPSDVTIVTTGNLTEGGEVTFTGSFSDAGSKDTHSYTWDFGDGTVVDSDSLEIAHTYTDNGNYTVTLTVTDDDGGTREPVH